MKEKNEKRILSRIRALVFMAFLLTIFFVAGSRSQDVQAAEDIRLNVSEVSIVKDSSFRLRAYNVPKNARIVYRSSDTSIAFVDNRGFITGISNGECIVTATVVVGSTPSDTLKCSVTVGPAAISIKLTKSEIVLGIGMKKTLKTIISPLNTVEKPVFYSADTLVASVTSIGRVRAKGVGDTNVFAFLLNGESAECRIYVLDENDYERYTETGTLVGIIEGYSESDEDKNIDNSEKNDKKEESDTSDSEEKDSQELGSNNNKDSKENKDVKDSKENK